MNEGHCCERESDDLNYNQRFAHANPEMRNESKIGSDYEFSQ